jgi:hypothetical protein
MSFDILFQTCNFGTQFEERKNPFTGQLISVAIDDGLTAAEKTAMLKLLRFVKASGPDDFGCYSLDLADGGSAELFAEKLTGEEKCDGCMVAVRSFSPQLVQLLFDLAREGNMVLMPVMDGMAPLAVSEQQCRRVQTRWPEAGTVSSVAELQALLSQGFRAWLSYRDQLAEE